MEFSQIRYFLVAAETLNFTRAAERCNVSQPALTRAIKKLEDEFGGPLFRRERSRTHLTQLGKLMKGNLRRIEDSSEDAAKAARQLLNLEKAPLNVGMMCTIGATRMVPVLADFQAHHPGIELALHDVTPYNMVEGLLSGELDCALLGLPTPIHERFDTIKLYTERMVAIFPKEHRFKSLKKVPLKELGGEQYLDRLNCEARDIYFDLLKKNGIELTVTYRSEREDWIQTMVQKGMGVCMIPEYSVMLDDLLCRPICEPDLERSVELVTVCGHRQSPAVQAFIGEVTNYPWPI